MSTITITDIAAEHQRQCQELTQRIGELCEKNNAVTKQRDALLEVCRKLAAAVDSPWNDLFYRMMLWHLLDELKDVVTADVAE